MKHVELPIDPFALANIIDEKFMREKAITGWELCASAYTRALFPLFVIKDGGQCYSSIAVLPKLFPLQTPFLHFEKFQGLQVLWDVFLWVQLQEELFKIHMEVFVFKDSSDLILFRSLTAGCWLQTTQQLRTTEGALTPFTIWSPSLKSTESTWQWSGLRTCNIVSICTGIKSL